MKDTKATIAALNELIETCMDGEEGFRQAAEGVHDEELKSLFFEYSSQRGQFVSELQEEVRKLGGKTVMSGSATAALHRGWMKLKEAVTSNDEGAIISECERGEDAAKEAYERAIQEDLPADVLSLVERQHAEVKQAHDRVRELETALS